MKINRRHVLSVAAGAAAGFCLTQLPATHAASDLRGRIRKSLKWSMVTAAKPEKLSLVDAFWKLRECGFDGVEPHLSQLQDVDLKEWTSASQKSGLIIDGTVGGRLENLESGLEITRQLGGDSMLVVVGYDQQQPLSPQWTAARERLQEVAATAEAANVRLLIENVWATFLISPFDMARFIDEVGSPWVQVHFDIGNMMRWGVAEHWAEVLGPRSKKLDVKEFDLDIAMNQGLKQAFRVPIGEGSINWPAVREELKKIDYQGWAAAEVQGGDWEYLTEVAHRMDRVLGLV